MFPITGFRGSEGRRHAPSRAGENSLRFALAGSGEIHSRHLCTMMETPRLHCRPVTTPELHRNKTARVRENNNKNTKKRAFLPTLAGLTPFLHPNINYFWPVFKLP